MITRAQGSPKFSSPFWQGLRDFLPFVVALFPFSVIVGAAMNAASFTQVQAVVFSLLAFTGTGQIVAVQMVGDGALPVLAVLSTMIVNSRLALYSASFEPVIRASPTRLKWLCAYLLTDQPYTMTMSRGVHRPAPVMYYLGTGTGLWFTYQGGTILGYLVGVRLPAAWNLDFAVPLSFISLLVPLLRHRTQVATALTSGIAAVLLASLPFHLNIVLAACFGMLVGWNVERFSTRGEGGE
ncbi:branched-chain amino acid ABC transporter permease [Deinococcus sp. Arct2-2]|uniref:AzlC family ABC transporter permease n=1 Tax=Deinococcus sp. Arct2-2 TaxID=2568653 RepID=UPI0010A39E6C|nr:AzlC family ABC transporter permease [Deinococcus sp. Arct2-2]THF70936.1 branched-chain amino acid ABC transporter permease [Deinococcus sp. Arct2-2]